MENCEVLSTKLFTDIMFRLQKVFRIAEQMHENLILSEILILQINDTFYTFPSTHFKKFLEVWTAHWEDNFVRMYKLPVSSKRNIHQIFSL